MISRISVSVRSTAVTARVNCCSPLLLQLPLFSAVSQARRWCHHHVASSNSKLMNDTHQSSSSSPPVAISSSSALQRESNKTCDVDDGLENFNQLVAQVFALPVKSCTDAMRRSSEDEQQGEDDERRRGAPVSSFEAIKLAKALHPFVVRNDDAGAKMMIMSPQDAAACLDILQRCVEQSSGGRLPETFVADVAYNVFFAADESGHQLQERDDGGTLLATAVAVTLRSVIAADYVNDDYLTGVGLAKCAALSDEMDVPAILSTLEAVRRLDRAHFSFAESEAYRKLTRQQGGDGGSAVTDELMGLTSVTDREADYDEDEDDDDFLSTSSRGDDHNSLEHVFHPNLISVIETSLEKRLRFLIQQSLASTATSSTNSFLLSTADNNVVHQDQEVTTVALDDADVDNIDGGKNTNMRHEEEASLVPLHNSNHHHQQHASFAPLCRPEQLVQLISEFAQSPSGVVDTELWSDLAQYFHTAVAWRPRSFSTEALLALIPKLAAPVVAVTDPLSSIALAEKTTMSSHNHNNNNNNNNSLVLVDVGRRQQLPTHELLSAVTNQLVMSSSSSSSSSSSAIAALAARRITMASRRDPSLLLELRQAFEKHPVLFSTAPALWDMVRTARIPRQPKQKPASPTGVDNKRSLLGRLSKPVPATASLATSSAASPHKNPGTRRIFSKHFIELDKSQDPVRERPMYTSKLKMPAPRKVKLMLGRKTSRKKILKRAKFSKRRAPARRLPES